jgi:hypothetical protein
MDGVTVRARNRRPRRRSGGGHPEASRHGKKDVSVFVQ